MRDGDAHPVRGMGHGKMALARQTLTWTESETPQPTPRSEVREDPPAIGLSKG